jgi:hypothetical protein
MSEVQGVASVDWFGHELSISDGKEVVYIFERKDIPRHKYRYVCDWIKKQDPALVSLSPVKYWDDGEAKWDSLSDEYKQTLETDVRIEFQNFIDIKKKLLAELKSYEGYPHIKKEYDLAIHMVEFR